MRYNNGHRNRGSLLTHVGRFDIAISSACWQSAGQPTRREPSPAVHPFQY
jgi:hypothetical protein